MKGTRRMRAATGLIATAAVAALALSACSSGSNGDSSGEDVTLNFTWWGNDTRNEITNNLIAAFEEEHPNITIEPQTADNSAYWDKLATQVAAGNTPDIMQMDELYISTYADRGVLMDINDLDIDLSKFPESTLQTGQLDGKQYALVNGLNTAAVLVNPTVLDTAGVALPDDSTWTWDDLLDAATAVSAAGGGDVFGLQSWGYDPLFLNAWLRTHGDSLYEDGEVSATPETMTSFFQYLLDLQKAGAIAPASAVAENAAASDAATFMATNRAGFSVGPSNQIKTLTEASGSPLKLLRVPTATGDETGTAYYRASQFWAVSSTTEHPKEAGLFLDFLANSKVAADFLLTERGVPANEELSAYIAPKLEETDQAHIAFLDSIADVVGTPPSITPPGGSVIDDLCARYTEQVMFGDLTPADAAKQFLAELKDAVANAD